MEKIPYETISDIQKRVNIVDVISKYLPITKRGKNYFAICPFHDDHNPSMSISEEKQIYTCFVCGASGNVFTFVQNYEKISFTSAVKKVASFIGINIDIKDDYKAQDDNLIKYDKYYNMFSLATKLYQNNIRTVYGKEAKKYLHNRSIDDDIIKEFNIGLSLNDNELSKLLESKGYIKEDMVDIGLCGIKDNYTYDIFRGRMYYHICTIFQWPDQIWGCRGTVHDPRNSFFMQKIPGFSYIHYIQSRITDNLSEYHFGFF